MYLSKLLPDPRSRQVQSELSNPYEMHRTLMSAFPFFNKEQERILYRLEVNRTSPHVLILLQSQSAPDWSGFEKKDYLLEPPGVKFFDPVFLDGQVFQFRLIANPVKRQKPENPGDQGKRIRLVQTGKQKEWLERKASENGFSILSALVNELSDQISYKKNQEGGWIKVTHYGVRFDGMLRVESPALFKRGLIQGLGPAKGFGFGLLSLAPLN